MSPARQFELNPLEFHVLLALASCPMYGYAIRNAVSTESGGTLTPRAGSLYRVLARFMASGLVKDADPAGELPPHPGLARKYYALTRAGRNTLAAEAQRLKHSARMAEKRLGVVPGRS